MACLNKVQLIGHVGKDPEIKSLQYGKVANFSIACTEEWKDKNSGEKKSRTEWANVAVFNEGLVGVVERFVKKGSRLYVEGKMQTRSWEKDGQKHYTTEVVLQSFGGTILLLGDPKASGEERSSGGSSGYAAASQGGGGTPSTQPYDLDDEIPF